MSKYCKVCEMYSVYDGVCTICDAGCCEADYTVAKPPSDSDTKEPSDSDTELPGMLERSDFE